MSEIIELLTEIVAVLRRVESHLYHIEVHCRPEPDEPDEAPSKRERTL